MLDPLLQETQVMEKLYLKTRSHSLDTPEGPLAEHLGAFEGLLTDQGYAQESTVERPCFSSDSLDTFLSHQ